MKDESFSFPFRCYIPLGMTKAECFVEDSRNRKQLVGTLGLKIRDLVPEQWLSEEERYNSQLDSIEVYESYGVASKGPREASGFSGLANKALYEADRSGVVFGNVVVGSD